MDIGIVSMRYAKALIEYAKDTNTAEVLYGEMTMLSHNLNTMPELRATLDNPILSIRDKFSLICTAASGSLNVSREYSRFITLVLRNHRENFLQFICLSFLNLYRQMEHIGVGKLITAVPVSQETEERIRRSAGVVLHMKMELDTEVNPAIEGGFIFDYDDFRLDASVATQLKRVKQQFIEKNRRIV